MVGLAVDVNLEHIVKLFLKDSTIFEEIEKIPVLQGRNEYNRDRFSLYIKY